MFVISRPKKEDSILPLISAINALMLSAVMHEVVSSESTETCAMDASSSSIRFIAKQQREIKGTIFTLKVGTIL